MKLFFYEKEHRSEDGRYLLKLGMNELSMGHWIRCPRLLRTRDDKILVDFWDPKWLMWNVYNHTFEGDCIRLELAKYPQQGEPWELLIDGEKQTYRVVREGFNEEIQHGLEPQLTRSVEQED